MFMNDQPPQTFDRERLAAQLRAQREVLQSGATSGMGVQADGADMQVGFRRFAAFVIDGIFLLGIGRLIAFLGKTWLLPLGDGGWWVGLVIVCAYFAILDSSVAQGKSFGKRLLRIEVRRTDGGFINPFMALVRFLPLAVVFVVFVGDRFGDPASPSVWGMDLAALLILYAIGTFAIVHPHRRTVQDLLVGSVVVRQGSQFRFEKAPLSDPLLVFGTLALLTVVAVTALELQAAKNPVGQQLARMRFEFLKRPEIKNPQVGITIGLTAKRAPAMTLAIDAFAPNVMSVVDERRAANLASTLADVAASTGALPPILDQISVRLRYGFNIGIWREMQQATKNFPASARQPKAPGEETVIFRTTPGKSRQVVAPPLPPPGVGGVKGPKVPVSKDAKGAKPDPKAAK